MEQSLQAALDETEAYLADTGLKLSPSKSELLLYRPARQGVRDLTPLNQLPVVLYVNNGQKISSVDSVKILGLLIDARVCNARTITHVTAKTENMLRLIARVSTRKKWFSEDNFLRMYQAFLMSHINYVASAIVWAKPEKTR